MKKIIFILSIFISSVAFGADLPAYFKAESSKATISEASAQIEAEIAAKGFELIGTYNPAENADLKVLVFTSGELKNLAGKFKDRGALAAAIRIGLQKSGDKVEVSIANPEYMFYAYWRDEISQSDKAEMKKISDKAKSILGGNLTAFGGELSSKELEEYHYKVMMPYFTDPVELAEFASHKAAMEKIENNLKSSKICELVYKNTVNNSTVYGIAFKGDKGESLFLPKIGVSHIAAMPYEIIVQGNEVTMLHGKYRLALYWPELTMSQFMKIMSTPGDIEDALGSLCK